MQTGFWMKQRSNRAPSDASRSRCGVWIKGLPLAPTQSYRCWSVVMSKMFGRTSFLAASVSGGDDVRPIDVRVWRSAD
jgi:hypothetical protein